MTPTQYLTPRGKQEMRATNAADPQSGREAIARAVAKAFAYQAAGNTEAAHEWAVEVCELMVVFGLMPADE